MVQHFRGSLSEYPNQQGGGNGPAMASRSSGQGTTPFTVAQTSLHGSTHTHTLVGDVLQTTPSQLRDWQQTDPTLRKVRELASSPKQDAGQGRATFFYRGGLIY